MLKKTLAEIGYYNIIQKVNSLNYKGVCVTIYKRIVKSICFARRNSKCSVLAQCYRWFTCMKW